MCAVPQAPAAATLVFAPGIGHHPQNTADNVADVIARSLDRRRQGSYSTDTTTAPAPRGLRAAKTVVGPNGERLLDVFELDYKHRMEDTDPTGARNTVPPGLGVALWDTITAFGLTLHAWGSPVKRRNAKVQLFLGVMATLAILVVGVAALIGAVGVLGASWGHHAKPPAKGVVAALDGVVLAAWVKARRPLLAFRVQMHRVLRYLLDERHQRTVTQTLDDAVDGLLDQDPKAKVHLLGYSFGSLVTFDALFPKDGAPDRIGRAVRSLATVGFLHDAVALYEPRHFAGRVARVGAIPWRNVFIPSDVLGSNLCTGDDVSSADVTMYGLTVASRRYTDEQPHWWDVLRGRGFRMHGGYWDDPDSASCVDLLTDLWVPDVAKRRRKAAGSGA